MSHATMPPVSVIVESCYELRWVGGEPIAQLVARTGAKPGSLLITTDQAEAYKNACVREALEETADNVLASDPLATRRGLAAAIRASIPE